MSQLLVPQSWVAQSGDTIRLPITVKDNAGVIVDLTGATVRFAIARGPDQSPDIDSAASPPTATAVIDAPATDGKITVTISDENTEPLLGDYYYECKVEDALGNESVVVRGYGTFTENLT